MNFCSIESRRSKTFRWIGAAALSLSFIVGSVCAKPPAEYKLDYRLKPIAGVKSAVAKTQAILLSTVTPQDGQKIYVYVRLKTADPSALSALQNVGLQVVAHYEGLVSGYIQPSRLLDLAALDLVSTISPVELPKSQSIEGQGIKSLHADMVHSQMGYDGKGVKVGVISNSFALFSKNPVTVSDTDGDGRPEITGSDSQISGDLPVAVELLQEATPYFADLNGDGKLEQVPNEYIYDDEGRALAEVVYDIAPGSELAYHAGTLGIADTAQGIVDLAQAGCKVIVDDQFFGGQPIFQDGEINQAIEKVASQYDVVYLTASGNSGDKSIEAMYSDVDPTTSDSPNADLPEKHDLHNWDPILRTPQPDPYLDVTLAPGARATVFLYWENPFSGTLGPGATTNYDMYFLSEPDLRPDTIIGGSDNAQGSPGNPMGDPVETAGLVNSSTDQSKTYYIAVNLKQGPPVHFKMIFVHNPRATVSIQGDVRSQDGFMQIGHEAAKSALIVGAVNYVELDTQGAYLGDSRSIQPTYYSNHGGFIPILYSPTGELLTQPEMRLKPDIVSVDGVNTSFFEGSGGDYAFDPDTLPNFLGTSCAAPHAAGVVALMRQANPSLTAAEIRRWARMAATDVYDPGVDSSTGWGLLYADEAVRAALKGKPPEESAVKGWRGQN